MSTIKLKHPIEWGSETVSELTLRRPKAKDLRKFPAEPTQGDILDLAGALAGREKSFMDELDISDLSAVNKAVAGFLSGSPATGTAT